jgi:hypothetical protein
MKPDPDSADNEIIKRRVDRGSQRCVQVRTAEPPHSPGQARWCSSAFDTVNAALMLTDKLVDPKAHLRGSVETSSVAQDRHVVRRRRSTATHVEVKRASDPRGRREVVAQMLDYAASLSVWDRAE